MVKKNTTRKRRQKPISLYSLNFDQAVEGLLNVKPEKPQIRKPRKKKRPPKKD